MSVIVKKALSNYQRQLTLDFKCFAQVNVTKNGGRHRNRLGDPAPSEDFSGRSLCPAQARNVDQTYLPRIPVCTLSC